MSRLTITLSEARYRALKEASARRDKTIGQLVDESLDFYGIKSREDARDLVRRARARSKLGGRGAFCKPAKVCREACWRHQKCEC